METDMSAEKLNTEIRREQIVQAALSLIASKGLRRLSVAGVARRVGLVPSAFYRHFKSKEEVIDAALDLIRDRLLGNVKAAREESVDPLGSIRRLLMRHVQLIMEFQAIPLILFSEEVYSGHRERKAKLYKIIKEYLDRVNDIVRQGQQDYQIRQDIAPGTLSVMFLGMFQPSVFLWHLTDGSFDIIKQTERTWQIFSEAIRMK